MATERLTPAELAERLGVRTREIYDRIDAGDLVAVRNADGRILVEVEPD